VVQARTNPYGARARKRPKRERKLIGRPKYDAIVIGAGPNGLAAAIVLARAGLAVLVLEAADSIGGGARSGELTLPGFTHDICSAVHPLAMASPFFRSLPLRAHGLEWIHAPYPLAHPFDDGTAVVLRPSLEETCRELGTDGEGYRKLVGPLVENWAGIEEMILRPLSVPRDLALGARFALLATQPATRAAKAKFKTEQARALFGGLAAHSVRPLESLGTSAIGLVLAVQAHVGGWPIPKRGAQRIVDALAGHFRSLGGEIATGVRVRSRRELPESRLLLCDVSPKGLLEIAGAEFPARYCRALRRYRYGPGVFKMDWALRGPIPWRAPECVRAATIHLGGTLAEICRAERDPWRGKVPERPFVLLAQPSLFDATRAPTGNHTAWAYCHVPNGCDADMTDAIEGQIERFAPGFKELILARSTKSPAQLEHGNANLVGGDVTGGANTLAQLVLRPTRKFYKTPLKGVFLCSASTPPGGGVHGMCGYNAAVEALESIET
jgi:phytoene dehydrogenase-like protein